jgi:FixJ family two-component response regulator
MKETVFIIDDDYSVTRSLSLYLMANSYYVETYHSSEEFLEREQYSGVGCIILDVNLEGKSGLELQEDLYSLGSCLPVIFITGRGNIHMSVETMKKGAINYLEKPFMEEELLASIREALSLSRVTNKAMDETLAAQSLICKLTPRETEVLKCLLTGMLNKQIAGRLNIAEHTVKLHRLSICNKLGVKSVPEVIRIADRAGLSSESED